MRSRSPSSFENLSVSALDLFATALGVFVLIYMILLPFHLKHPGDNEGLNRAKEALVKAVAARDQAASEAKDAAARKEKAKASLEQALQRQKDSEARKEKAGQALHDAAASEAEAARQKEKTEKSLANLSLPPIDLMFVVDATGSMKDEINDVQQNLLSILRILSRFASSLQVGFVAFKDKGDDYITKSFPLSPMEGGRINQIQGFVETLMAKGGGDVPEPVGIALQEAMAMPWRNGVRGQIVVIGDAPAHAEDWDNDLKMASGFAARSEGRARRALSAIYTGPDAVDAAKESMGRDFYEKLAAAGGGEFIAHRGRMIDSVILSVIEMAKMPGAGE